MIFKKKHTSMTMVIIGLIITVFFTSAGLIYIKSVSNVMTSDAHSNVVKLAARGSGTFSLYFTRIIDQLRTFSRIITDNEVEDIEEFGSISKNLSYANDFKSICIFDKNGNGYNFLSNLEVKAQNKPFFEEVKNGHDFISSPFIDQNGNDVITVSSPIIKDGVFYGAVVAFIPTSYLSEVLLTTYTPSETTASFIIDSDANIVFSSIKRDKRTNIEEVVNDINTHVHINKKLTEMHFLTALTTGKMASGEYKDEKTDMLFSFMPLKLDKEWSYIIVTPSKNVVETGTAVMDLSWKFVAVALMFLFVVFIIIIKFKNKTTKALTDLALYDQITGIPNWTKFKIDCEEYFKKSPNGKVAMVSFDIDEFKVINDLYGHKAGDETLAFVAKQLQKSLLLDEKCGIYSSNTFL
ncbi:MAG: cache domain-containing protein, partial [Oscillospiraceae bacterium]